MSVNFKTLEILRGLAAFYVVINHARGALIIGGGELSDLIPFEQWSLLRKVYYGLLQLTSLGPEAVIVFFVLSGLSIAHSLKHNISILAFYKKRLIRLYLPYIVALIYAALTFSLINETINLDQPSVFDSVSAFIKNLFYMPNGALIPQFWSLPLEVIFYILAPVILFSNKTIKYYYLFSILAFISSFIYSISNIQHSFVLTKFLLDNNIYFALGIFAYKNISLFEKYKQLFKTRTLWLLSLILIPSMILINHKFGYFNKITFSLAAIYSIGLVGVFLTNPIKSPIFQYIGKISYTLYVSHFATILLTLYILHKLNIVDGNAQILNPYIWLISIPMSVLVAVPLYYIGEYPTTKLLKHIRSKNK
jgi:peptidoglycan/LPS O-acetylase OafA/YrhL